MFIFLPDNGGTRSSQFPDLAINVLAGLVGRAPGVTMYSTSVICNDNPLLIFRSIFHCFIPLGGPKIGVSRV